MRLLGLRGMHLGLESLKRKFQNRLGKTVEELKIPDPNKKQVSRRRKPRHKAASPRTRKARHPKNIFLEDVDTDPLFALCVTTHRILENTADVIEINKDDQQKLMRLTEELKRLLDVDNLQKRFPNVTDSRGLDWYRREFERFLQYFEQYISD